MVDLGTLTGGTYSAACAVSADGSTVVGDAEYSSGNYHAFRWTSGGGMVDLGTLTGGTNSSAFAVSADGSVVTGYSETTGGEYHAFRWASATLTDLGTLGGPYSEARGISADGSVVVGTSDTGAGNRAFRWTEATGMQTVEDWLRDNGVSVPTDITDQAYGTNADGSVVVGQLSSGYAFIARGPSGLVTLNDLQNSLAGTASGALIARPLPVLSIRALIEINDGLLAFGDSARAPAKRQPKQWCVVLWPLRWRMCIGIRLAHDRVWGGTDRR